MADEKHEDEVESPEIHFEPIVQLPPVEIRTLEEDEEDLVKLRAKLYRFDNEEPPGEWKERGTGDIKILKHKQTGMVRILMRRDKTHKICANHFLTTAMELVPNCGSEKAFVWHVSNDFADEEAKQETLAIKFANEENAKKFKEKFIEGQKINEKLTSDKKSLSNGDEKGDANDEEDEAKEADKVADSEKAADEVADLLDKNLKVDDKSETNSSKDDSSSKTEEKTADS